MRARYTDLIIMSAELSTLSKEENAKRTKQLDHMLTVQGITHSKVLGMYNGSQETSFMVLITSSDVRDFVINLGKFFEQESILDRDSENNARLIFLDNSRPPLNLGKLVQVSQAEAFSTGSYTYEPIKGQYYTTV